MRHCPKFIGDYEMCVHLDEDDNYLEWVLLENCKPGLARFHEMYPECGEAVEAAGIVGKERVIVCQEKLETNSKIT